MSMTAAEVRELTDSIIAANITKQTDIIDNKIEEYAHMGERNITTEAMTKRSIIQLERYYSDLGFEVNILGNNRITISW